MATLNFAKAIKTFKTEKDFSERAVKQGVRLLFDNKNKGIVMMVGSSKISEMVTTRDERCFGLVQLMRLWPFIIMIERLWKRWR